MLQGKTVEVGRAYLCSGKQFFASPLVQSCPPLFRGEFETGFERGGQTGEHVQLAKNLGVTKLVVAVNKMDEPTVQWSKERFDQIEAKMTKFLYNAGYREKKDINFIPISGLLGTNMKTRMGTSVCPWWDGPCLFEVLDAIQIPFRDPNGPFRMPIISKSKDVGTFVMGKIESGTIREGDDMLIMPNKAQVKILALYCNEDKVSLAGPGENLRVRLSGIEDEGVGFVLCSVERPIPVVSEFVALLQILDLPDYGIFCAGFTATLYMNAVEEDCMIVELIDQIDTKTRKPMGKKPVFGKKGMRVECRVKVSKPICLEKFTDFDRLGRFTLRSNEITVAAGMVTELASTSNAAAA